MAHIVKYLEIPSWSASDKQRPFCLKFVQLIASQRLQRRRAELFLRGETDNLQEDWLAKRSHSDGECKFLELLLVLNIPNCSLSYPGGYIAP